MIPKFSRLKLHPFITAQFLKARYQRAADLGGSNSGFLMTSQARHLLRQHLGWKGHSQALSQSCWQEVLVLQLVGLSSGLLECPHDTVARFPQTDGSERERKNKHQEQGFCSLVLDCTPSFPFSSIIRNKSLRPHSCGGELGFTSWRTENQSVWEHILKQPQTLNQKKR